MSKVVPLFYNGPSVEDVLKDVMETPEEFRSIVIVAVSESTGEIVCWGSGHREDVCASALTATEYAKAHLRGELDETDS